MKIVTTIKRRLAKVGIGDPLNALVYEKPLWKKRKLNKRQERAIELINEPIDRKSRSYKVGYLSGYAKGKRHKLKNG